MSRTRLPSAAFLLASLAALSVACWAQNASTGTKFRANGVVPTNSGPGHPAAAFSTAQPSNEGCSAAALRGTYVVQFDGYGTISTPPQFSASDFFPISVIGNLYLRG
jgi:hypothetical protein